MIYYSNGYDLEKRQQSEARIDRIGQERPMTYIDIICEKTVDTRIVKALRKKVRYCNTDNGRGVKRMDLRPGVIIRMGLMDQSCYVFACGC